jgi:hypothetical protein
MPLVRGDKLYIFIVIVFMSDVLHLYAVIIVFMLYEASLWTSFGPGLRNLVGNTASRLFGSMEINITYYINIGISNYLHL